MIQPVSLGNVPGCAVLQTDPHFNTGGERDGRGPVWGRPRLQEEGKYCLGKGYRRGASGWACKEAQVFREAVGSRSDLGRGLTADCLAEAGD